MNSVTPVASDIRLSSVLCPSARQLFSSFCSVDSNCQASDAARLFALRAYPFVVIVGPTGWGKTHLLNSAAQGISEEIGIIVPVQDAADYCRHTKPDLSTPLILDNVQEAFETSRSRLELRMHLERRMYAERPTLLAITAPRITRNIRTALPAYSHWHVVGIQAPYLNEREEIVVHLADQEGLVLADSLVKLIAKQMNGNGRTISGALNRLRHYDRSFDTAEAVLRAMGLIDIFFRDNSSWDLKGTITQATGLQGVHRHSQALAVHLMHRTAGLPEREVANAANVLPGEVYSLSEKFSTDLQKIPGYRQRYRDVVNRVIDLLLNN